MDLLLLVVAVVVGIVLAMGTDFAAGCMAATVQRRRQQARRHAAQFGMEVQLNRLTQQAIQQMLLHSRLAEGLGDRSHRPSASHGEVVEGEAWDA